MDGDVAPEVREKGIAKDSTVKLEMVRSVQLLLPLATVRSLPHFHFLSSTDIQPHMNLSCFTLLPSSIFLETIIKRNA